MARFTCLLALLLIWLFDAEASVKAVTQRKAHQTAKAGAAAKDDDADDDDDSDDSDQGDDSDDSDDSDDDDDKIVDSHKKVAPAGRGHAMFKAQVRSVRDDAKQELAQNRAEQAQIKQQLAMLQDESGQNKQVDDTVKVVADETQSKALAGFLGDMWKEMRMFASPFYKEHLEEKLIQLHEQERELEDKAGDSEPAPKQKENTIFMQHKATGK
eukprot:gnl/TRDRNA2_/TRDRNA2_181543_c0_seq1.p1 gnl/TRDRNA2_/TRDRNA2_181543_c0~~gnl/TRDRNA2_/TRDRNA2_181543_c0_seq1.p1  ORF type:complete len:213 (+),score=89.07 gnl/TRDRNA2_/TRDRNA2_181543_c0_seq1:66-704(+)